jgi:hypothetical protein
LSGQALDVAPGLSEAPLHVVPLGRGESYGPAFAQPAQGATGDRPEQVEIPQQLSGRIIRRGLHGLTRLFARAKKQ